MPDTGQTYPKSALRHLGIKSGVARNTACRAHSKKGRRNASGVRFAAPLSPSGSLDILHLFAGGFESGLEVDHQTGDLGVVGL